MDSHFHFYHSSTGRGSALRTWLFRSGAALAVLALALAAWYSLAPVSLARALGKIRSSPLAIEKLELEVNGVPLSLAPGDTVQVDPRHRLRYLGFASSRWLNYDLAAFSPDFELSLVTGDPRNLLSVLGEEAFEEPRTVTIEIREGGDGAAGGEGAGEAGTEGGNRSPGETRAVFSIYSAFSAEDWALMADAAAEPERKIELYRRALALSPADQDLRDKLVAVLTEDEGRRPELAELLEGFLAEDPEGPGAKGLLARLFNVYRGLEDRTAEARTLERLLDLEEKAGGDTSRYRLALAALYRAGEPDRAARLYEGLLNEMAPEERLRLLRLLIEIYSEAGQPAKAYESYERILPLANEEQAPGVWGELVRLAEELGDRQRIDRAWEGLARSLPEGDRKKADAWRHLGTMRAERDDMDGAEAALREASALAPEDPALYRALAAFARRKGDQEALRENLEKALALGPDQELKRELALAYSAAGMRDEALPLWRELSEPQGGDAAAEAAAAADETTADARARLLDLLRPPEGEVSADFDEALYRYSKNGVEFYNVGVAHFKKRQWDAAEKAFLKVLELKAPGLERDTRGYLMALYREKRDTPAMLAQAETLYRADPSVREHRDLMAGEMELARSWEALEKAASEWTALNPSDPDNWRYLALAQRNMKRPDSDVAKSLQSAARAEPKSVPSWLAAAEALEKAGDAKAARVAYEKVLELDEKNDKAGQAILRLNLDRLSGSAAPPPSGTVAGAATMAPGPADAGSAEAPARGAGRGASRRASGAEAGSGAGSVPVAGSGPAAQEPQR
ncbi:MAG: hypothetical protein LBQ12_02930 [Deltaproteobacteria bacterium]|jgi:tetratricopeptide (TPR) repeat protein|nr:hypothetical protein [Deltaproteobacteria bacterium]